MKKAKFCLLFFAIFLTACSSNSSTSTNKLEDDNKPSQITTANNSDNNKASDKNNCNINETSTQSNSDVPKEKTSSSKDKVKDKDNTKDKTNLEQNITDKVKNYIINGQGDKPEAKKIKWSKTFLDKVDIESLYKQYLANGGKADDLEGFARYMTLNAPIPSDWRDLFAKDLYDNYGEKVARLEPLNNDLYQAYIIKDGVEIPYVAVSARTGYFHG